MNKLTKTLLTILSLLILIVLFTGAFEAFNGHYLANAPVITSVLIAAALIAVCFLAVYFIKALWKVSCLAFLFFVASCNYAKSNQQVLISSNCGMDWKLIAAGDAVPKGVMDPCYMKVVIPNFPMQGDSKFITNLKDRVRASVHIDYDYSITNPLAFIKQAKYLGKANADPDSEDAMNNTAFEGAENMVIDKRIKDIGKSLFLVEDIVELDQADLENALLEASNKVLEPLGVHLNFITLTFDLDEQTRQAIDVSTAMKIYDSKNLGEIGKQVMAARAGATRITVENRTAPGLEKE